MSNNRLGVIDIVISYNNDDKTYQSALANIRRLTSIGSQNAKIMQSGFNNVNRSVQQMGQHAQKTTKEVTSLGHSVKALWGMWAVEKGRALGQMFLNASMEVQKADMLARNTFKDSSVELDKWAKKYQNAFNLNPTELKKSVSVLGNIFTNAGVSSSDAMSLGKSLTLLGQDLGLAFGQKTADALVDIRSAMVGQTEGIQKYGVQVEESYVQQVLMAKGIKVTMQNMSGAEKIYARYLAILTQTSNQQGFYAKALEQPFGKLQAIKNSFQTLAGMVGGMFGPVINSLFGKVLNFLVFANAVAKRVAELLDFKMPEGPVPQDLQDSASGLGDVAKGYDQVAQSASNAQNTVSGFDKLNLIDTQKSPTGTGELDMFKGKLPQIDWKGYMKNLEDAISKYDVNSVAEKILAIKGNFGEILNTAKYIGLALIGWKLSQSLLSGFDKIKGAAEVMTAIATGKKTRGGASSGSPAIVPVGGGLGGKGGKGGKGGVTIFPDVPSYKKGGAPIVFADVPDLLSPRLPKKVVRGTGSVTGSVVRGSVASTAEVAGALGVITKGANASKLASIGSGALNLAKFAAVPAVLSVMVTRFIDLTQHSKDFQNGLSSIGSFFSDMSPNLHKLVGDKTFDVLSGKTKKWGMDIKDVGITAAGAGLMLIPGLQPFGVALLAFEGITLGIRAIGHMASDSIEPINVLGEGVSDLTNKKLQPFLDTSRVLDDQLKKLDWGNSIVTQDDVDQIGTRLTSITNMISTELNGEKNKRLSDLKPLQSIMGTETYDKIYLDTQTYFDGRKKQEEDNNKKITEILQTAANARRDLTQVEMDQINKIRQDSYTTMIQTASESAAETETILRNLKENAGRVTLEQASDQIKTASKLRDDTIKTEEDKFSKLKLEYGQMHDLQQISDDNYKAIVDAAEKHKNEEVQKSKDKYKELIEAAKTGLGDLSNNIDIETGKIKSKWDLWWADMNKPETLDEMNNSFFAKTEKFFGGKGDMSDMYNQGKRMDILGVLFGFGGDSSSTSSTPFIGPPAPKVPSPTKHARGGVFTRPRTIEVAENGVPEVVGPIGNSQFIKDFAVAVGGIVSSSFESNRGNGDLNISMAGYRGNARQFARDVRQALASEGLRYGEEV